MILGVGELLWDIFPDGGKVAGGAPFNFAFHCHQLGHPAAVVSRVGDDELGRELREEVTRLGMSDEFIQTDHEHPTGSVRVTVDEAGQPSYEIVEDVAWDYIAWDEMVIRVSKDCDAVCFGTLARRAETSRGTIDSILNTSNGLFVVDVNLRGEFTWRAHHDAMKLAGRAHWYKMNVDELNTVLDGPAGVIAYEALDRKESPLRVVFDPGTDTRKVGILTRGVKSAAITDWQRTIWVPGVSANVVDTVGAGDAFTAAMVCLHLEGKPLAECARFAVRYAAKVCEHQGATPRIDRREIE